MLGFLFFLDMTFTTINPYNLKPLQTFQFLSEKELFDIVVQAEFSFFNWKNKSLQARLAYIPLIKEALLNHKDDFARLITAEMGKSITQAYAEVEKCALLCDYYVAQAPITLQNKNIPTEATESFVKYEPLGTILGIMPWNFPVWQVFRFVIPTIIAGNNVLIKHAPNTFGTAVLLHKVLNDVLPKGVYNNIVIDLNLIEPLIAHPVVKAVSLTGSEKAGSSVALIAGKYIKKCVLELGGSNAFIVCKDADISLAVEKAIQGRLLNNGQSCIAAKRFLIHEDIKEQFLNKLIESTNTYSVENPEQEFTKLGPLARVHLAEQLQQQVDKSIKKGAKLIKGGKSEKAHFSVTILDEVKPGMAAFDEELFGPVFSITTFSNMEEAVAQSNQSTFGLGVTVMTNELKAIKKYIPLFNEGAVFVNEFVKSDPRLPFGGVKNSGYGRELSENGLLEFVNVKTVYVH